MKKLITLFLCVVVLLIASVGCQPTLTAEPTPTDVESPTETVESPTETIETYVGVTLLTLANEFFVTFKDNAETRFAEAGIKLSIESADMDTAKQLSQIENFITMGATDIFIWPIDLPSVESQLMGFKEQGVKVYPVGWVPEDKDSFDLALYADQALIGDPVAKMAAEWIDLTFPDAPDGSIEVGVIINSGSSGALMPRCDALKNIETYTTKAIIVQTLDLAGDPNPGTKAQELVDAMMIQNPNIKVILTAEQTSGMAANTAILRMSGIDFSKFGVFSADFDDNMGQLIADSATNESVLRCGVSFGDISLPFLQMVQGTAEVNDQVVVIPAYGINIDNLSEFYSP